MYAIMSSYSKSEDCPIFESCDLSHVQWSGETGICIPQKCEYVTIFVLIVSLYRSIFLNKFTIVS